MQQLLIVVGRKLFFSIERERERERAREKKWEKKNQPKLMNFILDVLKRRITKSVKRERETHTHTHTERHRENSNCQIMQSLFSSRKLFGAFSSHLVRRRGRRSNTRTKTKAKTLIEKGISFSRF
jgi:23S rRNA maturation mini-RNase III